MEEVKEASENDKRRTDVADGKDDHRHEKIKKKVNFLFSCCNVLMRF
jgi:hypothetical protein